MKYENDLNIYRAIKNKKLCVELLKEKFMYVGEIAKPISGFWLLTDGTLLECGPHGNIDRYLIKEGYITNNGKNFNALDGSQFMDYINAVRIRNEVPHLRFPAYLTLPKERMNSIQMRIVENWIKDILLSIKTFLIIDNGFQSKRYGILEDDKAIDDIKFYYRTGEFSE